MQCLLFVPCMMNTRKKLQVTAFILVLICFVFNLLITSLFFLNMNQNMERGQGPYCETCTELCGVWKCFTVTTGKAIKKMEMEKVFPFIVATSTVNLVLGMAAIFLMICGFCQKREEKTGNYV